jgi:hypothetical protein
LIAAASDHDDRVTSQKGRFEMSCCTAADAILALINSKPRTPTKDELVAIIAKAVPNPVVSVAVKFQRHEVGAREKVEAFEAPRLRGEWDALATDMVAVDAKCCAISEATDGCTDAVLVAEDEASEVQERFNDCARRILKEPVRNQSDLILLAEACYWWLYSELSGLWAPEAEAQLAGSPAHAIVEGGVCEEAVVALLKGLRDVGMRAANRRPPRPLAAPESDPTTQELPFMSPDRGKF